MKKIVVIFLLIMLFSCKEKSKRLSKLPTIDSSTNKSVATNLHHLDPELVSLANHINSQCPCKTKYNVSIDSAQALPNMTFRTYYTTSQKDYTELYSKQTIKKMKKADLESLRSSERMDIYRQKKVTLEYVCYDSSGHIAFEFSILPYEYAKK